MRKQKSGQIRSLRNFSIGQLERLHTHYHWARDRVLRKHGLRHVHLAMIRLIRLSGSQSLHALRQTTGYSRSAMNKHRDFLVELKLIKELPRKGDKRMVRLGCTERGKRKLEEIDGAIEVEFMGRVGFEHRTSLKTFASKLQEAFRDFPEETTSANWIYSIARENKVPEEQLFVPPVLPARNSQAPPSEKPSSAQGNGASGDSQADPDWPPF